MVSIPYAKGLSETIKRNMDKYNIKTVFRTQNTIGKSITKLKDPVNQLECPNIIYSISCSCGDEYIGETERSFILRLKEHQRDELL